jgi:hypothetical protein
MTTERIQERLNNRIKDLHATIGVLALSMSEALANGDKAEVNSCKNNIEILQELLESAYKKADEIRQSE